MGFAENTVRAFPMRLETLGRHYDSNNSTQHKRLPNERVLSPLITTAALHKRNPTMLVFDR
jgi:hypothetical protein